MPDTDPRERLFAARTALAGDLRGLLSEVFPVDVSPFQVTVTDDRSASVYVAQTPSGTVLTAGGAPLLRLVVQIGCTWNAARQRMAVRESSLVVGAVWSRHPLFHCDFEIRPSGTIPSAHINVHGHRDEMVLALTHAGRRFRGMHREAAMQSGRVPALATFHFPVGGPRFRPSLADLVDVLVVEFGLDVRDGWRHVLRAARARQRSSHLHEAVQDDPRTAAEALAALGYQVGWSHPVPEPGRRDERVAAL